MRGRCTRWEGPGGEPTHTTAFREEFGHVPLPFRSCYGSSPVTAFSDVEIPPDRAVKTPTAPIVMTARTTPYSAIVWPSCFRHIAREKSSHSEYDWNIPFTSSRAIEGYGVASAPGTPRGGETRS